MKNMKKKILAVIMATLATAGIAGCANNAGTSSTTDSASNATVAAAPSTLLTPGVLKVGVEIGYPPFELFADDGVTPTGFDIELSKEIADRLGLRVEYENTAWDGIFAGLDADKYDVIMSAVTISPERVLKYEFSTPYIENWQCLIVRKGDTGISSMEDLNGKTVGYQGGTTSDEYLTGLIETGQLDSKKTPYDKILQCFEDLKNKRIDVIICDSTVAEGYLAREPGAYDQVWSQSTEDGAVAETFGVCIKKGNTELQTAVNAALADIEKSGKLAELQANWIS
ncbi:basic amino acid ABC transporter substrate-binding protein [Clostridia bacterium]|nr:basic amino acid ABC transporter substrate-binding protein [Clostridia bacterium]